MQNHIEQIASKHLGKAGDGTIVKPYVTPDFIDKSLLVAVPRHLNRTAYEIDDKNLPFVGTDVWNAYEFSTMTDNGFPVVGHAKITYSADSENIVESKSLKLYMNSFNMVRLGPTVPDVLQKATAIITADLREILGDSVKVRVFNPQYDSMKVFFPQKVIFGFSTLEGSVDVSKITFDAFNEDPSILKSEETDKNISMMVSSAVLRSNCRVTNQPDWGDVFIYIMSKHDISRESILQYLVSMRKENHFHEEICECIYKRLHDKFNPDELFVACLYTRRGGIDINPVRASHQSIIDNLVPELTDANTYNTKLWRQ